MKSTPFLLAALALAFTLTARAEDTQKIAYPTPDAPSFIIEAPSSWELTPADEDGGYFHLSGPNDATLSFRSLPGSEDALKNAIQDSLARINEKFTDVEMGDAKDWKPSGLTGFYAIGGGKEKDGTAVRIGVAWCELSDGKIVEMWFVANDDDETGIGQAQDIVNSLTSP